MWLDNGTCTLCFTTPSFGRSYWIGFNIRIRFEFIRINQLFVENYLYPDIFHQNTKKLTGYTRVIRIKFQFDIRIITRPSIRSADPTGTWSPFELDSLLGLLLQLGWAYTHH